MRNNQTRFLNEMSPHTYAHFGTQSAMLDRLQILQVSLRKQWNVSP